MADFFGINSKSLFSNKNLLKIAQTFAENPPLFGDFATLLSLQTLNYFFLFRGVR